MIFPLLIALAAAQGQPMPVNVGGRVIAEPDGGSSFGWPGVYFESRFRGSGVRLVFEAPAEHMRLLIDGQEKAVFRRGAKVDASFAGLPPGDHVVRLEKMTESQSGGGVFRGFYPIGDSLALPAPARERQIEFIGDSYTVGYGNTSPSRDCTVEQVHDSTDTQQAFGPLVARKLDADYRINAYSGFGIVRNYGGGSPGLSLPILYDRLKPDATVELEQGRGGWHPQLIVVNLGTNDFSTAVKPGEAWADRAALEADYRDHYRAFIRKLAVRQPQARFLLMGSEDFLPLVEQVAAVLREDLPGRVTSMPFGGLDKTGCQYHPSLADERRLAASIEAEIVRLAIW